MTLKQDSRTAGTGDPGAASDNRQFQSETFSVSLALEPPDQPGQAWTASTEERLVRTPAGSPR